MKDFNYIIMIVPTYFLYSSGIRSNFSAVLVLLAVLPPIVYIKLPGLFGMTKIYGNYYPFIVAVLVWYLYLREIHIMHVSKELQTASVTV